MVVVIFSWTKSDEETKNLSIDLILNPFVLPVLDASLLAFNYLFLHIGRKRSP